MVPNESLSILVVDDSEFFGNLVADTLQSDHGMTTTVVTEARNALSDVAFETIDCIVSDYQMPDLNGLDLYQAIDDQYDIPFILVTSEGDEEIASRAIRTGVDEYILKADVFEEESLGLLANRIENIVDRRRTQQKYERLVDNSPDEISQLRLDGTILAANNKMATAFNTSESTMVGSQLSAFLPEDVAENRLKQGRRALTAGSVVTFQDSIGLRHFHNIVVPLATGEGETVQIVTREITLQKHNEEELKRKKEELTIINRIISHDIKNDVSILTGWAEVLEDYIDEEGEKMLTHIEETSTHIAELTEITKDFVESLEGGATVDLEAIDLSGVISNEVEKLRSNHEDISVAVDSHDELVVRANELLSSVVGNLLANAVRHNNSDRVEIDITTETTATAVTLRVADNGPGVADGQKEDIFGKGEKGPESPGTGIGLYLVYKLVDQYNGDVWIEDNEPTGAVFVVELPLHDPEMA
jgi:PAS domain S-box-containing protein